MTVFDDLKAFLGLGECSFTQTEIQLALSQLGHTKHEIDHALQKWVESGRIMQMGEDQYRLTNPKLPTGADTDTKTDSGADITKQLEKEGTEVALDVLINARTVGEGKEQLEKFMNEGAKRFQQAKGRPMTYAEMRMMWG